MRQVIADSDNSTAQV